MPSLQYLATLLFRNRVNSSISHIIERRQGWKNTPEADLWILKMQKHSNLCLEIMNSYIMFIYSVDNVWTCHPILHINSTDYVLHFITRQDHFIYSFIPTQTVGSCCCFKITCFKTWDILVSWLLALLMCWLPMHHIQPYHWCSDCQPP